MTESEMEALVAAVDVAMRDWVRDAVREAVLGEVELGGHATRSLRDAHRTALELTDMLETLSSCAFDIEASLKNALSSAFGLDEILPR